MIGRKSHPPFLSGRRQGQLVSARSGQGLVFCCLGSSLLHYSLTLPLTECLGHLLLAVNQVLFLPSCWVSLLQHHTHPPFLLGLPSSYLLVGLAFGPLSCLAAFGKRLSALHVERPSLHFLVSRVTQRTASY